MKKNMISMLAVVVLGMHVYVAAELQPTLYLGLCTEFWDLDKPTPPANVYAFYRKYIAETSGPILEPMCGTGRYLIPYLEEGFTVEGFDASPFMIDALNKKCSQKNLSPHVWAQFLEEVPESKQYSLIFIPDTSFGIFLNEVDIIKALKKIYALLLPGGTFVFDLHTTSTQPANIGLWSGLAHKRADGMTIIESMLNLPVQNSISSLILRYDLMNDTGIVKTETEHYQCKFYKTGEMDALLKKAGFKRIKRIKAHDGSAVPSERDYVVSYECKK